MIDMHMVMIHKNTEKLGFGTYRGLRQSSFPANSKKIDELSYSIFVLGDTIPDKI